MIQRNLTPCAGQGINPLLTDGADAHTTPALLPRPLSVVGVVAAVAPVTPEATHVRAVLVEVRLPRGLRPRPARDMRVHRLWHDDLEPAQHVARVRLEDGHADAAHDAGLRPRDPRLRVLPAVLAMVQDRVVPDFLIGMKCDLIFGMCENQAHPDISDFASRRHQAHPGAAPGRVARRTPAETLGAGLPAADCRIGSK